MKRYLTFIIAGLSFYSVESQTIADALLYSKDNLTGTARFSAMGGAFGALGGDFSSIQVNPAGSAVFSNNQASITFSNFNVKNSSDYFGSKVSTSNIAFDISQAGGILVFKNTDEKNNWKKITLAVDYENTSNLDNSITTYGNNPNQSVAQYFLSYANPGLYNSNIPESTLSNSFYEDLDIRNQQAFLGYQGYIINPILPDNNTYEANVAPGDFYQENYVDTKGYNGKVALNLATQYKDKFFFGLNLNTHFTDFEKKTLFYEENDNSQTPDAIKNILFGNYQHTYGNGFSFQLGAIAKVTKSLRAGLSYQSPTWYRLTDEKIQLLSSSKNNAPDPDNYQFTTDSDILLIYPAYKLQTPSKWTGSLAYVFGKNGLISLDYSIKDYGNATFKPNDSFFRPLNAAVDNQLHAAGELHIGGEYRIKEWSLRGGYRYEQSPYKDKKIMGDLAGFSTGFGYNFGTTRLDLSYAYAQRKSQEAFFTQGFTSAPKIKTENNNFALTLVFEL
ncbi:outer membrane protein transport protein [Flavobacterium sp.]|uniref:OmpP1/FadL family transporter n=1 Tax=Flavobacterium sp. TaxID=239 RepID=UPI00286B5320|nr:outer membrane protein transport protein [Flavobacterium sp.]